MPDNDNKQALQREIENILEELQTARDEIRVRIHLAGMELKDKWNDLEPRFDALERQGEKATQTLRDAAAELREAFRSLLDKLP